MGRILLFFALSIVCCCCYEQEFTYYTDSNYKGDSVTVKSKRPDLLALAPEIIQNHKSFCWKGQWKSFTSKNYTREGVYESFFISPNTCYNISSTTIGSIRYLGPADTNTESISLYDDSFHLGNEVVIERAYAFVPFTPQSLITTAWSNWTLYSGGNFNGTATCYTSATEYTTLHTLNSTLASIRSVLKGCNRNIDVYVLSSQISQT